VLRVSNKLDGNKASHTLPSLRVECVSLIGGHFKATLVVRIVDPDPYVSGDSKKIQRTPREKYGKGFLGR